jgi:hypothetical protein
MTDNERLQPRRLMSRRELREKYGAIPKDRLAPEINPDDVPEMLRPLIPLAEKWGIVEDDWEPRDIVEEKAPRHELEDVVHQVSPYVDTVFNEWLAGPEAEVPEFTTAYLAFTELRTVYWTAKRVLKIWNELRLEPDE